ncbi:MAG TPA: phosphatidylserine decarboxylase [Planococcus sp. (in: firmicutes)]|nr:phosphatidylserine decarboxylase [Planococcus sp. (in: firmicutes)]
MKKKLYQRSIELTNGPMTSGLIRHFAKSRLSRKAIPGYIKTYKIDMADVAGAVDSFPTLHDFFIRQLTKGSRPIAEQAVVSPVDAKVEIAGDLHDGIHFLVKGQQYSLEDLLGNAELADFYREGKYIVLYLSPADYHRIHSPVDGNVLKQYVLGKKSYPVNQAGLQYGKAPISGNYRMITELDSACGRLLMVKVGAMFVNSIELTNFGTSWKKGEEAAYFSFGSTVVLFFERGKVEFSANVQNGNSVRVGEALAHML